jgi:antitoxin component HigA of HigAB toxin-antitoxin module
MKILDKEIDFNLTDVDNMEKFRNALEKVQKLSAENKETDEIKQLRFLCQTIRDCFIEIFGNDELLPKNNDYIVLIEAFEDLSFAYKNKNETGLEKLQSALSKYGIK